MEGPDAKRRRVQRLQSLLHTGGISEKGLRHLLKKAGEEPLPSASRYELQRANAAIFQEVKHVEEMPLVDGGSWQWELAHPCKVLQWAVDNHPALNDLYADAIARYPCSPEQPWHIVLGFDEYIPGNKLKTNNWRKTMTLGFNFVELGRDVLAHDASWMMPICLRASRISLLDGGWGHCFRRFCHLLLLGPVGLETSGVALNLRGVPTLLWAKLGFVVADGDGHRQAWDWKGASGMRPCLRHYNVLAKASWGMSALAPHPHMLPAILHVAATHGAAASETSKLAIFSGGSDAKGPAPMLTCPGLPRAPGSVATASWISVLPPRTSSKKSKAGSCTVLPTACSPPPV